MRIAKLAIYLSLIAAGVIFVPRALSGWLGSEAPIATITSSSMWPELKKGDLVFIEAVKPKDIKIGDILVWRPSAANDSFVIHRVVELRQDSLRTKGDANTKEDQPISYDQVVGRTVALKGAPLKIPWLGNIAIIASDYIDQEKLNQLLNKVGR